MNIQYGSAASALARHSIPFFFLSKLVDIFFVENTYFSFLILRGYFTNFISPKASNIRTTSSTLVVLFSISWVRLGLRV